MPTFSKIFRTERKTFCFSLSCLHAQLQEVRMLYRSGTADTLHRHRQTLHVHSPSGSTLVCDMTLWPPSWKRDVKSKIRLRQSMLIYLNSILAKFHPDPNWNDTVFLFWRGRPNNKMSSDMRSVPGLKAITTLEYRPRHWISGIFVLNHVSNFLFQTISHSRVCACNTVKMKFTVCMFMKSEAEVSGSVLVSINEAIFCPEACLIMPWTTML